MIQPEAAALALAVWNLAVFVLYGIDKHKAKRKGRRIPERTLLGAAALMGAPGALAGMLVCRHKTKHPKFVIGVPLLLIVNIAMVCGALYMTGVWDKPVEYQKISPETAKEMMDGGGAVILDVRTDAEYAESHIEGAVLLPNTDIAALAPERLPDKGQTILVYCRSGRRSESAARELIAMGYTRVYDFGGIIDWPYGTTQGN